jgi:CubicO group peptidase (beta-lactamase class C family)
MSLIPKLDNPDHALLISRWLRALAAMMLTLSFALSEADASVGGRTVAWPAFVSRYAGEHDFSGTILVAKGTRPVYVRSFGLADRTFSIPARNDTRYRIASITKLFTATLVLQMVDEGKLDLSVPIARYLPQYPGEGGDRITVRQLLNHSSGIAQFDRVASLQQALSEGVPQYQKPQTPESLLAFCCSGRLAHPPGTVFDYNNADYIVLGRILERVSGQSYARLLEDRILRPRRLTETGIAYQDRIIPRLAPTYYWRGDETGWMNDLPVYFQNWDAAGAMYSTAGDLLKFANALYGGDLISKASLAKLLEPGLDDYGFGLWSYSFEAGGRRHRVAKRPGSIMGANTQLYRLPDDDVTIVILANTNRTDLDVFAQKIAEAVLR